MMKASLFVAASMFSAAIAPAAAGPCEAEMVRAAKRHGVPVAVLYAVSLTETGRSGRLSPYALNIEGQPVFAESAAEARRAFDAAFATGARLIDLGCMQINHRYHARHFASVDDMLTPARNVDYGARFLAELRRQTAGWTQAVARYHAGAANLPAQKTYICRVTGNLAKAGLGKWTPQARAFCGAPPSGGADAAHSWKPVQ